MVKLKGTTKAIRTPRQQERVQIMIKDLGSMNLKAHVKDDDLDTLVNHITEINGCIKKKNWEGSC